MTNKMQVYSDYLPKDGYRLKALHALYDSAEQKEDLEDPAKFAINLEKCIYNIAIKNVLFKHGSATDSNKEFLLKHYYTSKAIKMKSYLGSSGFDSSISPVQLIAKSDFELFPERYVEYFEQKALEENRTKFEEVDFESIIKCWKCKKNKVSYYEIQLRSSDEPSTLFCHCVSCGNRFRIN